MAILNLVLYPDAPLRDVAEPYREDEFGLSLSRLAENMLETMRTYDGVGLAGPQIGVSRRIFVLQEPHGEPMVFVNPEILGREGTEVAEEGCLSLPDIFAPVQRAARVSVLAYTPEGAAFDLEATGMLARIIQHESDHLDGVCFVDRIDLFTRQEKLDEWEAVREEILNGHPVEARRRHAG